MLQKVVQDSCCESLESERDGCLLGEHTRWRPDLFRPACPRRPAVRRPDPDRSRYVRVSDSGSRYSMCEIGLKIRLKLAEKSWWPFAEGGSKRRWWFFVLPAEKLEDGGKGSSLFPASKIVDGRFFVFRTRNIEEPLYLRRTPPNLRLVEFTCRFQNPNIPRARRCGAAHGGTAGLSGDEQQMTPTGRFTQEETASYPPDDGRITS